MTIREAGKGEVKAGGGTYNIGFGGGDETQLTAFNMDDLEECWRGFCKDERIRMNSVNYVERV